MGGNKQTKTKNKVSLIKVISKKFTSKGMPACLVFFFTLSILCIEQEPWSGSNELIVKQGPNYCQLLSNCCHDSVKRLQLQRAKQKETVWRRGTLITRQNDAKLETKGLATLTQLVKLRTGKLVLTLPNIRFGRNFYQSFCDTKLG